MPRIFDAFRLTLALAVAGCATSLTDPPTGLPVTITAMAGATPSPVVGASGDSVYVTLATSTITFGCAPAQAEAGVIGAALVTTVTLTQRADIFCTANLPSGSSRIAVHQVPPGRYVHRLRLRTVPVQGEATEQEVARGDVVVP